MERQVYDNMAEVDGRHWWFVARRRIIEAMIAERIHPAPDARVLEVGCGTGSNLALLKTFGSVEAIEPDAEARAFAARRSGVAIRGGTLPGGAEIDDGAYDLVTLFDVLEHIPDDRGALAELSRKLKPSGRLLVTVPAMPWLWSGHDVAHHHQRRYTAALLRRVLAESGFRTLHLTYFNSLLFPLVAAARAWARLTGREGGNDALPPPAVNDALREIFAAERHVLSRFSLPFGVSLAVIAEPIAAERLAA
ncbi:MAG TPA: class I SAM-dependent methyltransferase [Allosphingosinicella sp.]|nr:class I SAM-dependent methyltransferase [Allosphingosinicella sp.]